MADSYAATVTDLPTVYTTVVLAGKRKVVKDYADAGPSKLWAVEQVIDKVLLDAEWDDKPLPQVHPLAPTPAATQPAGAIPYAVPGMLAGIGNFGRVSPVLYRGEQPTTVGFAELKKLGVRTIVCLRSFHGDSALLEGTGLRYFHIHAKPWHPEDEDVAAFLRIVVATRPTSLCSSTASTGPTGQATWWRRIGWSKRDGAWTMRWSKCEYSACIWSGSTSRRT